MHILEVRYFSVRSGAQTLGDQGFSRVHVWFRGLSMYSVEYFSLVLLKGYCRVTSFSRVHV